MKKIAKKIFYNYCRHKFKSTGIGTKINPTASIHDKKLISFGKHSFIGKFCHISVVAPATLTVGNYVTISPFSKILGGDHRIDHVGKYIAEVVDPNNIPITIEDDIWIGMNAMILKGVTIGEGAVIGAKALVADNILPYTVAVGIPAKMIRLRFKLSDLHRHMETVHSRYDFNVLKEAYRKESLI